MFCTKIPKFEQIGCFLEQFFCQNAPNSNDLGALVPVENPPITKINC